MINKFIYAFSKNEVQNGTVFNSFVSVLDILIEIKIR
jgi:hypothetical protein